jgi:hypothetical protein
MALESGTLLGPYEILSLIGAGGMDTPLFCQEKKSFSTSAHLKIKDLYYRIGTHRKESAVVA